MYLLRWILLLIMPVLLVACSGSDDTNSASGDTSTLPDGSGTSTPFSKSKQESGYLCNSFLDTCHRLIVADKTTLEGQYEECSISTESCQTNSLQDYVAASQLKYAAGISSISDATSGDCSILNGVYTCLYNSETNIITLTSELSSDKSSYSVVHSFKSESWKTNKLSNGFVCNFETCTKLTKEDDQYNGIIETCIIAEMSCSTQTIYAKAKIEITKRADEESAYAVLKESKCKFFDPAYYACSYASKAGTKVIHVDLSDLTSSNADMYPSMNHYSLDIIEIQLDTEFSPKSILPVFSIQKPEKWRIEIPEIEPMLDAQDDWNLIGFNTLSYNELRTPMCLDNIDGFSYSCIFGMQYQEYHQCDFSYLPFERVCNVYSTVPPKANDRIEEQLKFHGFDPEEEKTSSYDPNFPVLSIDRGCEIDHELLAGKVTSTTLAFAENRKYELDLNDQQDKNLMRWEQGQYWAGIDNYHCAAVTAVISSVNGPNLEIISFAGRNVDGLPPLIKEGSLVGVSLSQNYLTATTQMFSTNYFSVWGAGNDGEDYSQAILEKPDLDFVWDDELAAQMIFVGGVDSNRKAVDGYAVPGNNVNVQKRWVTALAKNVWSATTTAFGKGAITKLSGTSLAQPYVTRAMAKGKTLCPLTKYSDIANVLLETADRSFDGYDPEIYGQGVLDVYNFKKSLLQRCP